MSHENMKKLFDEAERRDKKALYDLGLMFNTGRYIDGLTIPKDEDEALYLITQSAKCGNSEAADWIYKYKPSLTDEEKEFTEGDKGDAYIRSLWSRVRVYNAQKRPVWRYERPPQKIPYPKFALVVLIAVIGYACFPLYKGIFAFKESFESNDWVQTTGIITEARVGIEISLYLSETEDLLYVPLVSYTYSVDNRDYTSNRITVLDGGYFLAFKYLAKTKVRQYQPKGRKVSVYYDPTNPARSVLKRGISFHTIVNIALGGFLVSTLIFVFRRARKQNLV